MLMGYAGFIDQTMNSIIKLVDGVRVREETCGLLFYDARKTELHFIGSGDTLCSQFFEGDRTLQELLVGLSDERKSSILRLLNLLKGKGLIYEQSIG